MNPTSDRTSPRPPAGTPAPRRRFRLTRLEERIAPAKGGQTKGGGGQSSGSGSSYPDGPY